MSTPKSPPDTPRPFERRALWSFVALAIVACGVTGSHADGIPEPPLVLYGLVTDADGRRVTSGELTLTLTPANGAAAVTLVTPLQDLNQQFSYALSFPCETLPGGFAATAGVIALQAATTARATVAARLGNQALQAYTTAEQSIPVSTRDRGRTLQVNLSTILYEDTDGDGLLDSWEIRWFKNLGMGPADDPDHDGASNRVEQLAGTDPTGSGDATPPPEFIEVTALEGSQVRVVWSTRPGLKYRLLQSASVSPPDSFHPVTDVLTGDGSNLVRTHALGPDARASFYRIEVVP